MSDIFLSYASEDQEQVRVLAESLTQMGWSVFWNRDVPRGKTWQEVLEEELAAAQGLVVVWSAKSVKRKWVLDEVHEGIGRRVPIFQVLIDRVQPPLEFRAKQAVNLSAWDGATSAFAFQGLVRSIRSVLGQPDPARPLPFPESREEKSVEPQGAQECTNSLGMRFVLIPAGTFLMGSAPDQGGDDDEGPQHQVTLSQAFFLQTTPVTQGQWRQVMGETPSLFQEGGDDCPVENVSWEDIQEFIKKLNDLERAAHYRLPTEAEWEYACRAGSTGSYNFGDNEAELQRHGWYAHNSERSTHPVGRLRPNAWGLYDMHGNVYEWCRDWYGDYSPEPATDPQGPQAGEYRVLRGGSWDSEPGDLRSAYRHRLTPSYRYGHEGFRLVRSL